MATPPANEDVPEAKRLPVPMGVALLVALGLAATAVVWTAMWLLPGIFVDADAYQLPNGEPDRAAAQDAYNSARVPIGVTAAAILAASAAAAGVWMNARTVAVARDSLAQVRASEDERRRQWHAEHLHSRFQDASKQLGDSAASVRLAGVLSMVRLADEWEGQRQSCIDVLTAYYRMPLDRKDAAEKQVRRVILDELLRRLTIGNSVSWSEFRLDLSGAYIEGLQHAGPLRVKNLILDSATISGFSYLDNLSLDGSITLNEAVINDSLRILATMSANSSLWMPWLTVAPHGRMRIGLWRDELASKAEKHPGFVHLNMSNVKVLQGGNATVSLWGYYDHNYLFASNVLVSDSKLTLIAREGKAEHGAVQLPGLKTNGTGRIYVNSNIRKCLEEDFDDSLPVGTVDKDRLSSDMDPRSPVFV